MINIDLILKCFADVAAEPTYVPALSINVPSGRKNVFIARPDDVAKPDYPYITVDLLDISQENGWVIDDLKVDNNDNIIYSTNYQLAISYHIYGKGARSIANQLEGYFRFDRVRDYIKEITGGVLVETLPIESLPQQLADKFVDASTFDLLFAITDSTVDTQSGVIDELTLGGELIHAPYDTNEGEDQDPSPLPVQVDVDYTLYY